MDHLIINDTAKPEGLHPAKYVKGEKQWQMETMGLRS